MIKVKTWKGNALTGTWQVTLKIDGVRALRKPAHTQILSKQGKPLYNLDHLRIHIVDCEVWLGDWETTASAVRSSVTKCRVLKKHIYALEPLDKRLHLTTIEDPSATYIRALLKEYARKGCDGLVLRQGETWLKVKPVETYDVRVMAMQKGTGKHAGRMGALLTEKGKVGTGFSDAERGRKDWVGKIIEVECLSLTPGGKFRHARYLRTRFDK